MSTRALFAQAEQRSNAPIVIGAALSISLALHLAAGWSIWALSSAMPSTPAPELEELAITITDPPEEEVELGIEQAESATINWLGVIEHEQAGEATESVVDQASLVTDPGSASAPTQSQHRPEPPAEQSTEPVVDPVEPTLPAPAEPSPVPALHEESKPAESPEVIEAPQPETAVPEKTEHEEPEPDPVVTKPSPPPTSSKPKPKPEPKPEPVEESPNSPEGNPGELSEREAIAMATDINYDQMHRPLVSRGIELITKQPRYPWSVRNAVLPDNAIVIIRFGRDGRVKYADFLVSKDGKRRYDTGLVEVNSPLLAAIYQWRAKGKALLELDENDPEDTIEIPMRVLFSKPRAKKTDDQ